MLIGLITTLATNIGDDLVRGGICRVLCAVYKDREIRFIPINKHRPYTVYPKWHPLRFMPLGKRRLSRRLHRFGLSRFDKCDLIVQCGAPVLWPRCNLSEWAKPLWLQVVGRLCTRIPVLNLAAGACYPWEAQPERIDDPWDAEYLRAILGFCDVTTVRDSLAKALCSSLGVETPLIPCSAFLAAEDHVANTQDDGPILISYMAGGGHYDWNQNIDAAAWRETVRTVIGKLGSRHCLAFLCHNEKEYDLALKLEPSVPRFWPRTPGAYFAAVSRAKAAICSRLHASVALAGMGIPSVAVCTDTRLLMVEPLGLPYHYVKEADPDRLEHEIEALLANRSKERERLLSLRQEAWKEYVAVVSDAIEQRAGA
ncbi:MAG: polysaccharide pyruvyl transferase family protein [Planctomycetota bacterium]|jgi:hypothetical protein